MNSCPNCGGTSGKRRRELVAFERVSAWGPEDSDAELLNEEPKLGRWECLDCGHRFNEKRSMEEV